MISGYDRLIIKVWLLMWSNKCDTVSLKKHETRWSLGLTGIGMDFIRFWEAEPEIGRDSLDFYLCKGETRWLPNVIACTPGVPDRLTALLLHMLHSSQLFFFLFFRVLIYDVRT